MFFGASRQSLTCLPLDGHGQDVQHKSGTTMPPCIPPNHTSQSCRLCSYRQQCVPCVVVFLLIRVTCIAAIFCAFHVFIRRHRVFMWRHTSCFDLSEHTADGSIVTRWDWHFDPPFFCSLHLIIAFHLGPPPHPILCHIRPIRANTLRNGLLPSPHPEPTSMTL